MPDEVTQSFWPLLLQSPPALIVTGLSVFFGYGLSFLIFNYGSEASKEHGWMLHLGVGLGYAAAIFIIVNLDIIGHSITPAQITERVPITLLISFAVFFAIMMICMIWKQRRG